MAGYYFSAPGTNTWRWDRHLDTWIAGPFMNRQHSGGPCAYSPSTDRMYIFGGMEGNCIDNDCTTNPFTEKTNGIVERIGISEWKNGGSWTTLTEETESLWGHAAFTFAIDYEGRDFIFLVGGSSFPHLDGSTLTQIFDVQSETVSNGPNLNVGRRRFGLAISKLGNNIFYLYAFAGKTDTIEKARIILP